MEVRQLIRPDVAVSALAHLSVLALVLLFSEVHGFGTVTAEPIAVDLVTPEEITKKPEPIPSPQKPEPIPERSEPASSRQSSSAEAPPASPVAPAEAQAQTAPPPVQHSRSNRKETAVQDKPQPQAQPQPKSPPPVSASVGYTPPEPDLTVKYHVMLGLPGEMPIPAMPKSSGDKPGDGIDATASSKADIESSLIAQFRQHLKTCSKLPSTVSPSESIMIKLRVMMTPEGRLAADPTLLEATASAKGPLLMQSAIAALTACQPYAMLPVDRYGEWKVIDLSFTPKDFAS
jgi:hypothetical protein